MITGREENIIRCMSGDEAAKHLAEREKSLAKCEREEQKIFTDWLRFQRREGKLYFVQPQSHKASTIESGHPDYTIWLRNGRVLLIEMKVPGGKLSQAQRDVHLEISLLNHTVHVAWDHVQAIRIVQLATQDYDNIKSDPNNNTEKKGS